MDRKFLLPLLLALAVIANVAWAAEPVLRVEAVLENGRHVLHVTPDAAVYSLVRVQTAPNTYQLIVAVPGTSGAPPTQYAIPITIGGAAPSPNPTPTPQPQPTPTPQPQPSPTPSKIAFLYVIHETADSTSAQAKARDAKAWRDAADSLGIKWLVVDKDQAATKFPVATKKAVAAGLPALVALDKDGAAVAEKQPDTPEAMTSAIKRLAGGGK